VFTAVAGGGVRVGGVDEEAGAHPLNITATMTSARDEDRKNLFMALSPNSLS
jgi:hypothetical protein